MKQKPIHSSMQPYLEGSVILIDKPLHWTSFNAVKKIRYLTGVNKVGHAGTLDPLATGLLIICTGGFTKKISAYMGMEKEYTGTFTLGSTTSSFDLETSPENFKDTSSITLSELEDTAKQFTGLQLQVPPMFSAIKKDGKPIYLLARKGMETERKAREIFIKECSIMAFEGQKVSFKVVCSTGTYIRSLANDFGTALGCGAHLSSLRRTRIGHFEVSDAEDIEAFTEKIKTVQNSR
jgi:tRNA pseudouridine55 synthase